MASLASRRSWFILGALALVLLLAAGVFVIPRIRESRRVHPPLFMVYIPELRGAPPRSGFVTNWKNPSAVAVTERKLLILDTDNGRVLVMDEKGVIERVLGEAGPAQFLLKQPEGMAVLRDRVFIANTQAGEVVILTLTGEVERVISLPQEGPDAKEPRPTGIAVGTGGEFYVSDTANNMVLYYDPQGVLGRRLGSGPEEKYTFKEPRGLAIDIFASLYVADTLNGRVKKFSPEGRHLGEFLMLGNPEYSWPVGVAVSADGTVYFSDRRRLLVQVFNQSSIFLGIIGLLDATRVDSPSVLREPYGLWMAGNRLYIMDRRVGLFGFDIDPRYWAQATGIGIVPPHIR